MCVFVRFPFVVAVAFENHFASASRLSRICRRCCKQVSPYILLFHFIFCFVFRELLCNMGKMCVALHFMLMCDRQPVLPIIGRWPSFFPLASPRPVSFSRALSLSFIVGRINQTHSCCHCPLIFIKSYTRT